MEGESCVSLSVSRMTEVAVQTGRGLGKGDAGRQRMEHADVDGLEFG